MINFVKEAGVAIFIGVLLSSSAQASGGYMAYGAGIGTSCGKWLEERATDSFYYSEQWVMGYVSGFGYASAYELQKSDGYAMSAFIDKYCREKPTDTILEATRELLVELHAKKISSTTQKKGFDLNQPYKIVSHPNDKERKDK